MIEVEVNGETREVAPETTVAALLEELGAARPGVAVAMNGHVVSRSNWADTTLSDGAQVEILSAVQGG
ncbi:sulfur carrier protein ThiS [Thermocrispum municipale]|uniref:sulfur carrier protein ThiS n=1 Tax=Thermocrispum municipale TaxID=37926 RepID=UPI00040AD493